MRPKLPKLAFHPMTALALSAGLILASIAMVLYQENLFERQTARETTVQAEILASSVTAALAFNDARIAQEYVNALQANRDIEAAAVFGNHDEELAKFVRPGVADIPAKVAHMRQKWRATTLLSPWLHANTELFLAPCIYERPPNPPNAASCVTAFWFSWWRWARY